MNSITQTQSVESLAKGAFPSCVGTSDSAHDLASLRPREYICHLVEQEYRSEPLCLWETNEEAPGRVARKLHIIG